MMTETDTRKRLNMTLVEKLEEILEELIVTGSYELGEKVNLEQLEETYSVSATPLKSALTRLSLKGLVTIRPRIGYFVKDFTIKEVEDAFALREILELGALPIAIRNITQDDVASLREKIVMFRSRGEEKVDIQYVKSASPHLLIIERSGNAKLVEAYYRINSLIELFSYMTTEKDDHMANEHLLVLEALAARDVQQASERLVQHLGRYREIAVRMIRDRSALPAGRARKSG